MPSFENGLDFDTFAMSLESTRGVRSGTRSSRIEEACNGGASLLVGAWWLVKRRMLMSWPWSDVGAGENGGVVEGAGMRWNVVEGAGSGFGGGGGRGDPAIVPSVEGAVFVDIFVSETGIGARGDGEEVFMLRNRDDGGWLFSVAEE